MHDSQLPTLPGVGVQFELPASDELDAATTGALELGAAGQPACGAGFAPRTFGRYRLERELGRGGMGVVYAAFDRDLRRRVALKVLRDKARVNPEALDRFVAEAQVTAQLQHPAIVPVYDMGLTDTGELFYTMRLIRGVTLGELARGVLAGEPPGIGQAARLQWTPFRVLDTFRQVCLAVAYAHERGVIHRDLKPQNVMVGRYGEVYVLDWGLARLAGIADAPPEGRTRPDAPVDVARGAETQAGLCVGTPAYMAPEQAEGRSDVAAPADVYALGGVLYALLCGRPPFRGSATSILARLIEGESPAPPSAIRPGVAPQLEQACMRALSLAPGHRQPSAAELARDVEDYLEGRQRAPGGADDSGLRTYDLGSLRRASVAVDVVCLRRTAEGASVLLQRRAKSPFRGAWALPGAFCILEETLEETARRVLADEAGVRGALPVEQLGAYGDPGRDPRTRVVSVAFVVTVPDDADVAESSERGEHGEHAWIALAGGEAGPTLPPDVQLAFDHAAILSDAWERAAPRP